MIEVDRVGNLETLCRVDRDELVVVVHAERLSDLDEAPRRLLPTQPCLVEQVNERRGGPVHDRYLGAVELDDEIVDAEAGRG